MTGNLFRCLQADRLVPRHLRPAFPNVPPACPVPTGEALSAPVAAATPGGAGADFPFEDLTDVPEFRRVGEARFRSGGP